jgi:hypothetical protein
VAAEAAGAFARKGERSRTLCSLPRACLESGLRSREPAAQRRTPVQRADKARGGKRGESKAPRQRALWLRKIRHGYPLAPIAPATLSAAEADYAQLRQGAGDVNEAIRAEA